MTIAAPLKIFNMNTPQQIAQVVKQLIGYKKDVHVTEYCYNCFFSGDLRKKTLIVLPDQLESKGIVIIDKPIHDVTHLDIIMKYTKLK